MRGLPNARRVTQCSQHQQHTISQRRGNAVAMPRGLPIYSKQGLGGGTIAGCISAVSVHECSIIIVRKQVGLDKIGCLEQRLVQWREVLSKAVVVCSAEPI